jgi:glucose-6-phosphate isomerase
MPNFRSGSALEGAQRPWQRRDTLVREGNTVYGSRVTDAVGSRWQRYCRFRCAVSEVGLALDLSRVGLPDRLLEETPAAMQAAFAAMAALENGALANSSEQRMVGHYWLRAPELSPIAGGAAEIRNTIRAVRSFSAGVVGQEIRGADGPFERVIHVGIGGSALGAQLVCEALGAPDGIRVHVLENVDPDGVQRLLTQVTGRLGRTLVSVVSKSGVTPSPRHVVALLEDAYRSAGLDFNRHAVATTMEGTPLDERARRDGWICRFPLWDWVGGRTSVTSAVGLLPAALAGVAIDDLLYGAAAMDRRTRRPEVAENPAALLALAWHWLSGGCGDRHMVVLPYRDRLALLPRYLQQLVMESLGKRHDRCGRLVEQGMTVYGNKGSTDQHAYMQQLREGRDDAFVTFVGVLNDLHGPAREVGHDPRLGDHLHGSLLGTRDALSDCGRDSITITLDALTPRSLGALIALYERAVGLYAELVDVNAYDQPGVDKYVAESAVALQRRVASYVELHTAELTAEEVATGIGEPERADTIHYLLERLAVDGRRGILRVTGVESPAEARYRAVAK